MKRWSLVLTTLFVLGVTYLTLNSLGWFRPHVQAASPTVESDPVDPLMSQPGTRWRHSEPHHWRSYMLTH